MKPRSQQEITTSTKEVKMMKWIKQIILTLPIVLVVALVASTVSASIAPIQQQQGIIANQIAPAGSLNVRVYYLTATYQTGRHAIVKVWCDKHGQPLPEDNPDTAINAPYGVLEFDLKYNRATAWAVQNYEVRYPNGQVIRLFYVNDDGQLCRQDGTIVTLNLNPQVEAYKLSQLSGMTQAQLETYIDNNVTNLTQAKDYLKKLSAVVLWLVKQSELGQ